MCKYCEEAKTRCTGGTISYTRNGCPQCSGGGYIRHEPSSSAYLMKTYTGAGFVETAIKYCPWCGRKLELPDDEAESSAEDEIARLDRRSNHTNALLDRLAENLERWVNRDHYNIDMKAKVLYDMKDIRGKLLDESC